MVNNNLNYPKFSVLMSVYKKENPIFLDEALKSVENQSVVPQQIVVVEDGKLTNELKEVLKIHRDNFEGDFTIVKSIRNCGLGLALRLGTRFVKNDWIARMDSDDISSYDRFKIQLNEICKDDDLVLIGGQIDEFEGSVENITGYRYVPTTDTGIRNFLKWRNPFNHPTVMIKKNILEKVGGYEGKGKLEDYFLWSKIIASGYKVTNVNSVLVHMRTDSGMYSRRGDLENLKYIFKLRNYLQKNGIINFFEMFIGDFVMLGNTLAPNGIRKFVYKKIIHK